MNAINANQQSQQVIKTDAHQTAFIRFFALPYIPDASGFYFSTAEEFESKTHQCFDSFGAPVEEFEILFDEGTDKEADLFRACGVNQANIGEFLELLDEVEDYQLPAVFYLCDIGYSMDEAKRKADEATIYQGNLEDAAEELFDDCYLYQIPEHLQSYIDYAQFAYDCRISGDMVEFEFGGKTYTLTNASGM